MITVRYEDSMYGNYKRISSHESKSFQNLEEFKDWMFGRMDQPSLNEYHNPNMLFYDQVVSGHLPINAAYFPAEFKLWTNKGGSECHIHTVSDHNKIVFSDGTYTNGKRYVSEGFKNFLKECMNRRDGIEQNFEFGELEGFAPVVEKSLDEQAEELVAQNPNLARAVFNAVQKQLDIPIQPSSDRFIPVAEINDGNRAKPSLADRIQSASSKSSVASESRTMGKSAANSFAR